MKLRMHTLPVQTLVVLFALSAALTAQHTIESDPELVLRADAQRRAEWASTWLHSEDPRQVAWGAWVARRDHQTALIPLLIEKVEEYQPVEEFLPDTVERNRHDMLCRQILNTPGREIPLRRLFTLHDYPGDVMSLYAGGFSVANYLVNSSNRPTFSSTAARQPK